MTEPYDSQLELNELKVNKALHPPPHQTLPAPHFPQLASQYNPNPHPTLTSLPNPTTPLLLIHSQTRSVFLTSLVTLWCLWNRVPTHSLLQDSRLHLLSTICLALFWMAMWLLVMSPEWLVVTATNVTTQEMTVGQQLLKMGVRRRNNYFFFFVYTNFSCVSVQFQNNFKIYTIFKTSKAFQPCVGTLIEGVIELKQSEPWALFPPEQKINKAVRTN